MSSPSRVPDSLARSTPRWRRTTAYPSSPNDDSGSDSVGPRSGRVGMVTPRAIRPASNFESEAGCRPQAVRRSSTTGLSRSTQEATTSTSTRRSCTGRSLPPTSMVVSSRASSATSSWPTRSEYGRRRVRTSSTWCSGRRPTTALTRQPTGPSGPRRSTVPAARGSVTSRRRRRPPSVAGRVSFSVASSRRPRRRVRSTKPDRAMRQSSVSRYRSTSRRDGLASTVTVGRAAPVPAPATGRAASHRSTGRRSRASNCHSTSTSWAAPASAGPGTRGGLCWTTGRRLPRPGPRRPRLGDLFVTWGPGVTSRSPGGPGGPPMTRPGREGPVVSAVWPIEPPAPWR